MEYGTLEDVWGVKTFETAQPLLQHQPDLRAGWEPEPTQHPVSGAWGWRPPARSSAVTAVYAAEGLDGVLASLPRHAVEELRARFAGGSGGAGVHAVAAVLLCGFVLLIMWDILTRVRGPLR